MWKFLIPFLLVLTACGDPKPRFYKPCLEYKTEMVMKPCVITPFAATGTLCVGGYRMATEEKCVRYGPRQCYLNGKPVSAEICLRAMK